MFSKGSSYIREESLETNVISLVLLRRSRSKHLSITPRELARPRERLAARETVLGTRLSRVKVVENRRNPDAKAQRMEEGRTRSIDRVDEMIHRFNRAPSHPLSHLHFGVEAEPPLLPSRSANFPSQRLLFVAPRGKKGTRAKKPSPLPRSVSLRGASILIGLPAN